MKRLAADGLGEDRVLGNRVIQRFHQGHRRGFTILDQRRVTLLG